MDGQGKMCQWMPVEGDEASDKLAGLPMGCGCDLWFGRSQIFHHDNHHK